MSSGGLVAQPLDASQRLNWVLVVELVLSGVLAVFFFNYVDRIFGTVVSYGIRAYTWRKYHAYIDVQGLQISLLGGRIFFKDLRYHGHNVTVLIHSGFVTWHYWFPRVRQAAVFDHGKTPRDPKIHGPSPRDRARSKSDEESGEALLHNHKLPCRVKLHVEGVQAFLYNRSPAYDNILDAIHRSLHDDFDKQDMHMEKRSSSSTEVEEKPPTRRSRTIDKLLTLWKQWFVLSSLASSKQDPQLSAPKYVEPEVPSFLRVMPIQLIAKTGAVILGNENTKSIITVKFDSVSGSIDADEAGPLDYYKIMFSFDIQQPIISMRPNMDFKELLLASAAREKSAVPVTTRSSKSQSKTLWQMLAAKLSSSSADSIKTASATDLHESMSTTYREQLPGEQRWLGLSRYVDDNFRNEHDEWDAVEYARSSIIADCPRLGFVFYWDVPGQVPDLDTQSNEKSTKEIDHVNGSAPPEYGMDLLVYGGNVSYGPWADRHRINFQNIFFPPVFANATPGKRLKPGETRISTEFKLYLCVEEETTLRVPIKEQSKDWKWRGRAQAMKGRNGNRTTESKKPRNKSKRRPFWKTSDKAAAGPNARPFAWLDVKIPKDSTVNYSMDMMARSSGFQSSVLAEIPKLEIYTSVNHGLLWRSGCTRVDCDLSVPLGFNTLRDWHFNIQNDDLELFILRDHLFLIVDVVADWASGPPSEFHTFTPFKYHINVHMRNFKLFLNANDSNIINDPANLEENHFVILHGQDIQALVDIPLDELNPRMKEVTFNVVGRDLSLQLCLNTRNTVATFVGNRKVAFLDEVTLSGSFAGNSETSTTLTDRLTFDIQGKRLTIWLFGFVIHHLITLKENYFGEHLHFKTLEEYQGIASGKQVDSDQVAKIQGANRSNDLDILMCISAHEIRALLPANIYKASDNIILDVPYFGMDLRLTSYYLDLQLNTSPLSVSLELKEPTTPGARELDRGTEIFVQSVEVNGHRAFGLPPAEPAYYSYWSIALGDITGSCSDIFVDKLMRATLALSVTVTDDENSLSLIQLAPIYDITFVQATTKNIKLCVQLDKAALILSSDPATVEFNDWAGIDFSQRLVADCPRIDVSVLDTSTIQHGQGIDHGTSTVKTHAYLCTSMHMSMLRRNLNFAKKREKQQEYVIMHDSRTHRVPFLRKVRSTRDSQLLSKDDPPAMSFPSVPEPLTIDPAWSASEVSSTKFSKCEPCTNYKVAATHSDKASSRRSLGHKTSRSSLSASVRSSSGRTPVQRSSSAVKSLDTPSVSNNHPSTRLLSKSQHTVKFQSSLAWSSPLSSPYFPLLASTPDVSCLPLLLDESTPRLSSRMLDRRESTTFDIAEDQTHTSIIIDTGRGVQCFVKPGALSPILQIVELVQPSTPDDLLDTLQLNMWDTIKNQETRMHGVGSILELRADIPNIAFRFLIPDNAEESRVRPEHDQFDVAFTEFSLMGRHSKPGATSTSPESASMHCTLRSLAISAAKKQESQQASHSAMNLRLDNLLTWLAFGENQIIHLSFTKLDIDAQTAQIEWMTGMIGRVTKIGNNMTKQILAMQDTLRYRFATLAFMLTTKGDESDKTDPVFILRPSYLLRAASGHVRNHDSWKIVSRFRYIFNTLPIDVRVQLSEQIATGAPHLPENAEIVVMNSWNHWRTWELSDVQESSAMRYLFNKIDDLPIPAASTEKRLQLSFHANNICLALNPGELQTDVRLAGIALNADVTPPMSQDDGTYHNDDQRKALLQVNAAGLYCNLDWTIIPALQNIIIVVQDAVSLTAPQPRLSTAGFEARRMRAPVPWNAQGVVVIAESLLKVATPNMNAKFSNNGMNFSLVGSSLPSDDMLHSLSVIIHAGEGRTDILAIDKTILTLKAESPTIYLSRIAPEPSSLSTEIDWRLAASSTWLTLDIPCEILDMIEVIDSFVDTELQDAIQRIHKLSALQRQRPQIPKQHSSHRRLLPKLNLALLMDKYTISIALLQAITYTMHGEQGRISMLPRLIKQVSLNINFDLDGHVHRLLTAEDVTEHTISTFTLPPVNGELALRRTKNRVAISSRVSVEQIELDASAVHALLSTCKRSEMAKTFEAIQADFRILKDRIHNLLPESSPKDDISTSTNELELVYNVGASLMGIRIVAQAPGKSHTSSIATLVLGLDCLQISAYNCLSAEGPILVLPEVQAILKQVFVEIHIRDSTENRPCGRVGLSASVQCTRRDTRKGVAKRQYKLEVNATQIHLFAETAATVVDVINHLQDRLKDVDLSREKRYLQRLRQPNRRASVNLGASAHSESSLASSGFLDAGFAVSWRDIEVCWIIGNSVTPFEGHPTNDLVLTIKVIDVRSKSRSATRLVIEDFLLQMVPVGQSKQARSRNSALMPEVVFNVFYASTHEERKVSLQAMCKSLNVRLESIFILLANVIQRSIILAVDSFRDASALWEMTPTATGAQRKNPFGDKRLSAFLVDVDFAGAVVEVKDRKLEDRGKLAGRTGESHFGRFGQFSTDGETAGAIFRTPGIAMKGEYEDDGKETSFTAEFKISGSTNALTPTVVPLVMDMSNSVKLIVEATDQASVSKPGDKQETTLAQSIFSDERLLNADPSAILGKTKINLGIRICRQEFSLGCQPIARVDAAVVLDDIYITANSVKTPDQDLFFAISGFVENLQASVQHVYSRESTFSFNMERLALSIMNSKHVSGKAGISAVLKIYPMKTHVNARQLQDFLLFRDIWLPKEIRQSSGPTRPVSEPQDYLVQRYQQVATATAFPWTASVSIQSIEIDLDMGQAIGKSSLQITDLWAASKKDSNWKQNLCLGIEKVAIQSSGRTSGFIELAGVQVRTSISWPLEEKSLHKTPLIQASAGFDRLRVKTAFDYEAFGIVDVSDFAFVMYNIREDGPQLRDRLVAILDGDKIQVCCTARSAAQGYALFQAVERLIQENQTAYAASLKDIERYLKRKSVVALPRPESESGAFAVQTSNTDDTHDSAIFLHTDVVVTLRSINLGAFPGSFSDNTVFLIEAKDIQGRFAVKMDNDRIHNGLGMTFGKVQVALTSVPQASAPRTLQEITVEDVVRTMVKARGGIILRVPKVIARMQTWQNPGTNHIDYIFRSSFEGKVDVGWNFSRIAFIRDMYNSHTQTLASRLGRALPESAVKITTALDHDSEAEEPSATSRVRPNTPKAEKITAVVNVPQSKYDYTALEPPIIVTPQLRDMGEATPPLEWIGLHRDRLPNVTHQILIVGLLGVARNVEDAYEKILGGSDAKSGRPE